MRSSSSTYLCELASPSVCALVHVLAMPTRTTSVLQLAATACSSRWRSRPHATADGERRQGDAHLRDRAWLQGRISFSMNLLSLLARGLSFRLITHLLLWQSTPFPSLLGRSARPRSAQLGYRSANGDLASCWVFRQKLAMCTSTCSISCEAIARTGHGTMARISVAARCPLSQAYFSPV